MADVEGAARRLLRGLNENQAHGREGTVVEPGEQEARDAAGAQHRDFAFRITSHGLDMLRGA